MAEALREAGYTVSTSYFGIDVARYLRDHKVVELLILDGSEPRGRNKSRQPSV